MISVQMPFAPVDQNLQQQLWQGPHERAFWAPHEAGTIPMNAPKQNTIPKQLGAAQQKRKESKKRKNDSDETTTPAQHPTTAPSTSVAAADFRDVDALNSFWTDAASLEQARRKGFRWSLRWSSLRLAKRQRKEVAWTKEQAVRELEAHVEDQAARVASQIEQTEQNRQQALRRDAQRLPGQSLLRETLSTSANNEVITIDQ